ncbi:MAG: hypothetical protein QMD78_00435 [Methanocellales archaeon]|nr:hypothetical protein [Methanocellales archaeon]
MHWMWRLFASMSARSNYDATKRDKANPTSERVWTLENKIRTLGEKLEEIKKR